MRELSAGGPVLEPGRTASDTVVEGVEDVVVNGDAVRAIGARAAAVKMARLSSLSAFSQFAM